MSKSPPKSKKMKEMSAREKAAMFARNVPKPKVALTKKKSKQHLMSGSPQKDEYEILEQ